MRRMRQIKDRWTEEDVRYLSQFGIKAKVGHMILILRKTIITLRSANISRNDGNLCFGATIVSSTSIHLMI